MSKAIPKSLLPESYVPGTDVLILSSDREFINHHRAILLSIGFVPITATTLEAALAVLRMIVIELVIVDEEAGTPESQSILIQARNNGQRVPVLVVSQRFDPQSRREALELGAAAYLDRPAFQDDVVQALLAHCTRRGNTLWGPQHN